MASESPGQASQACAVKLKLHADEDGARSARKTHLVKRPWLARDLQDDRRARRPAGPNCRMASTSKLDPGAPADPVVFQGRYLLHEVIGRGGMATVYRALDTVLDRPVAVKLLRPSVCAEERFIEQFLTMERHVARLFHPHLVRIFDAGTSDEGCFAVMEYVPGGSLRDLLNRHERPSVSKAIEIVTQVAEAPEP